jgi:DNA-directed RNA polymerase II subunit RPB2
MVGTRSSKKAKTAEERTGVSEEDVWYLVMTYLKSKGLVRHQIDSFNHFMHTLLPYIVSEMPEIRTKEGDEEHVVWLCNVSVRRPTVQDADGVERDLLPHLARLRGITYASTVLVDIVHDIYDKTGKHEERRLFRETTLCRLPVLLGSDCCHTQHTTNELECRLDQGGYFIVSGCEKVLVAQEKLHHNTPYVFKSKTNSGKYELTCEIRSCHEKKLRSTSSLYLYVTATKKGATPGLVAALPFVSVNLSVMALFRLLGVQSRQEAMSMILGDDVGNSAHNILASILDNDMTRDMDTDELYEHIGKEGTRESTPERRRRYLEHIVNSEVLPHMGLTQTEEVRRAKAFYLGYALRKLIGVYNGEIAADDRDHMSAKRVDANGTQFGLLFRQLVRGSQKSFASLIIRTAEGKKLRTTNVGSLWVGKKITQGMRFALATGSWGMASGRAAPVPSGSTGAPISISQQNGVTQQLGRVTVSATLSLLRKVATPIARETKNPKPRQLHASTWGLICPMDTPEGSACGLTKSLAMLAHVRVGCFSDTVSDVLSRLIDKSGGAICPVLESGALMRSKGVPVLLNGVLMAYTKTKADASELAASLRAMRRKQDIPFDTTVALSESGLIVDTDGGCLLRPLFVVERMWGLRAALQRNGSPAMLMDELIIAGIVEYIDKQEEEELRVAPSPLHTPDGGWEAYTHAEIEASMLMGLCGGCIPFPEFNQSPRNCYQCAMAKQALGVFALNWPIRMDTVSHVLLAPQRPIVTTRLDGIIGASDAPSGVNCIVAIMSYTGQNQEDSVILNEAAVQRGLFRSVKMQLYRDEERQNGGSDSERIEFDKETSADIIGSRDANYGLLGQDGVAEIGSVVTSGDVIISKTITTTELGEGARKSIKRDKSTVYRGEAGSVDAVLHVVQNDGTRQVRVRVRITRTPAIGDKFSSRMGQKGVVGLMLPQHLMPFTEDGLVPDIIVNPHAIPSRMTIGQLAESLLAILCTLTGQRGNGTAFRNVQLHEISDRLEKLGYDRQGRRTLYNGFSGERFDADVFLTPTYYQRLRHMSSDKDHARARGPLHMLSRQPTEGRARAGGLRFGEMERDTLIAHGAAEFMKDRLLDNSDPSTITICSKCGAPAHTKANHTVVRHQLSSCRNCGARGDDVKDLRCPFAFRLLVQELAAMGISMGFEI